MDEEQRNDVLRFCGVLTDKVSRKTLAYMEAKKRKISIRRVPSQDVLAEKSKIIARLSRLERDGLVKSEMVDYDDAVSGRVYEITPLGATWVHRCMVNELGLFQ